MFEYSVFHRLPAWSQAEVLTNRGTLLAQRKHKDYTISLYCLDNHFVEVWAKGGLWISASFKVTAKPLSILEPYLDEIAVQDLLRS